MGGIFGGGGASEKTETLDRSVAVSLSRKRQSPDFWTHLLVDGLSLRASAAEHENDDGGGAVIQMVMPPTVVRMKKVNDEWKYDGRDEERSNKVMKEFMQEQKERFGGGGRTDF